MNRHAHVIGALLLVISLALVCLPRFNRNDLGLVTMTGEGQSDAEQYVLLTQFFKGNDVNGRLDAPFTHRPLVPFVASLLPVEAMTGINIVNLLALLVAVLFLYKILKWFGISFQLGMLGCGLFVFSFPTFYYGTIGYVDPVLVGFLMMGTYCILTERRAALALVIVTGAFVKETIIVLLPILAVRQILAKKTLAHQLLFLSLLFCAYSLAISVVRSLDIGQGFSGWSPSLERFLSNASRPRAWLSFILSFGVPGFLSLAILRYRRRPALRQMLDKLGPLVIGQLVAMALFGYSMASAYADGRFVWTSYAFSIPIAIVVLDRLKPVIKISMHAPLIRFRFS